MAEIEAGISLLPKGVPWLYAVFAMLFAFFLCITFSPFLLEIDQHIRKCKYHDLRKQELQCENVCMDVGGGCRCSLRNASDKGNKEMKMDHLGRPRCLLQVPGGEALRREAAGVREDSSVLVEMVGERTQEVCPVTSV
ncbi:hypothetical protein A6R68_09271 [Neotoma lepida]|uniref:Uncharacterized protein n=1 Tax=Neotoma lepida TaxID=56216 RepID=A0A1A6G182_NEOLE|nr:hypothetical protein A6R68_09271 [Neotoma lepida]